MQMTRLLSIAATAGLATSLAGCGTGEASTPTLEETAASAPVPVETTLADRGDIYATYEATATMESDIDAPVNARVGGDVVKIYVEEGDVVAKGDVLARLDGQRLKLESATLNAVASVSRCELDARLSRYRVGARFLTLHLQQSTGTFFSASV